MEIRNKTLFLASFHTPSVQDSWFLLAPILYSSSHHLDGMKFFPRADCATDTFVFVKCSSPSARCEQIDKSPVTLWSAEIYRDNIECFGSKCNTPLHRRRRDALISSPPALITADSGVWHNAKYESTKCAVNTAALYIVYMDHAGKRSWHTLTRRRCGHA